MTALLYACRDGKKAFVELLLGNKATNVDIADNVRKLGVPVTSFVSTYIWFILLYIIVARLYGFTRRLLQEAQVHRGVASK